MIPLILTRDLCKSYAKVKALDHVSLSIVEGSILGLFGANGAGKSTLIRVLSGITRPDSGSVMVKGVDVVQNPTLVRDVCSTIVEIPNFSKGMRLYDLLEYYYGLSGEEPSEMEERLKEAVYVTGTGDVLDKKFGRMSLGQQHRAEIARAIATSKDIMLLDEPFIGIDVETKKKLKDHFRKWVDERPGRAIIFTSHNLLENEEFVNSISFIKEGRIMDSGTLDYFKNKYLKASYVFEVDDISSAIITLQSLKDVQIDKFEGNNIYLTLKEEKMVKIVNKELSLRNVGILQFKRTGSVEDVFSHIMEAGS
ncbi:MAG: ABC transporter ATP-binding protein [Candidatus Thermoplasmatota archaeon]|jgi:ABC-2 type transport system ATP-binding protein|nr:ABC transporter ATP-binding protein [Candidatus Thermoplasmatota archaeon]